MADNKTDISIIGAGASGIISVHQLVEKLLKSSFSSKKIRIYLFDRSGVFGPGLAYSTPLDSHLINMRTPLYRIYSPAVSSCRTRAEAYRSISKRAGLSIETRPVQTGYLP